VDPASPKEVLNRYRITHFDDYVRDDMRVNRLFGLKTLIDKYLNEDTIMCEIGSFEGASSELFALTCKTVYCVDVIFQPEFDLVQQRRDNIVRISKWSKDAAKTYKDRFFDFVYIDGSHIYKDVKDDINSWKNKVKLNGYLGGHDYLDSTSESWTGVIKAVNEVFDKDEIKVFEDSSWIVKIKNEENNS